MLEDNSEDDAPGLTLQSISEEHKYTCVVDGQEEKVNIYLNDGVFERCYYGFTNPYSSRGWELLSVINEEIKRLEKKYSSNG